MSLQGMKVKTEDTLLCIEWLGEKEMNLEGQGNCLQKAIK